MNQSAPQQRRAVDLGFKFPQARDLFPKGALHTDALRRAVIDADAAINSPQGQQHKKQIVASEGVLYEALYGSIIFIDHLRNEGEHGWVDEGTIISLILRIAQSIEDNPDTPYPQHTRREFIDVMKRKNVLSDEIIDLAGYGHFLDRDGAPHNHMHLG